jgi:hypothetical protein
VLPCCTPLNILKFRRIPHKVNGVGGTYTGHTGRITQTNKCPGTKPNSSGTMDCEMLLMLGFLKGIRILSRV